MNGGNDPGAIDPREKNRDDEIYKDNIYTKESSLVLKATQKLNKILEYKSENIEVQTTRTNDQYVRLGRRAAIANYRKRRSDLFVSIHANSFSNSNVHGVETLYYPNSSGGIKASLAIQNSIVDNLPIINNRGLKARNNLYVLRKTHMPAVLVELGFISNTQEEKRLNDDVYLSIMMNSIADGIIEYLNKVG